MPERQLEAGLSTTDQEKQALATVYSLSTTNSESQSQHRKKMPSVRRIILVTLALVFVTLGLASAVPAGAWSNGPCEKHAGEGLQVQSEAGNDDSSTFSFLLNAASGEALHEVLHRYFPNRFKDGVYPSDKTAMEAVHREDPMLATSLVNLAKRQGGGNNSTTVATTAATTTPTTPVAPTTTPTTTPVETPTTTPTTTTPATTTPTTSETTAQSTTAANTSRSRSAVLSTFTSTASNGGLVVVTQTSYVDPDPTTGTNSGSIQTNAAVPCPRNFAVEAFAGVVLGGFLLI